MMLAALLCAASVLQARPQAAQAQSVPSPSQKYVWVNTGSIEGHLATNYSPAGAFSPDGSTLAVIKGDKIVLVNLEQGSIEKVLHPKLKNLRDLEIESANYLNPDTLFLLGTGIVHQKKKVPHSTPLIGFTWNTQQDAIAEDGKVDIFGRGGGFGRPRYFPRIAELGMYKKSTFILWSPVTRKAVGIKIPDLTRRPHLFTFSPDGHWLLLARISGSGSPNPIVVKLSEHKFVDTLSGYKSTVMSMRFSHDGKKVVTASADGEVRIWSAPEWKLLETLSGHKGPARWAAFSPHGNYVASGGEDTTVRIWSTDDGKLLQTLSESHDPIDTVAFSPNGNFVAATTDHSVLFWKKTPTGP